MPDHGAHRAAVLGSPVAHSLSPVLHNAAYAELGLTSWTYEAIECTQAQLTPLLAGLGPEWVGLSLTMPLKRVAMQSATSVSRLATQVGAANTLVRSDGGYHAENTDVAGIVGALRQADVDRIEQAVVLGAGGTAQAAMAALRELGHAEPIAVVRDVGRASELAATAERLDMRLRIVGGLLERALPAADLIISTLPATAADDVRWPSGRAPQVVFDAVYAPWPTVFARAAQLEGARVIGGLDMLLHQATEQVRLFTGRAAPVESMRAALYAAAAART
jgi:shikimate dehydrogenase